MRIPRVNVLLTADDLQREIDPLMAELRRLRDLGARNSKARWIYEYYVPRLEAVVVELGRGSSSPATWRRRW